MLTSQCFIKIIYTASFNTFFLTSEKLAPSFWMTSAVLAKGNYKWKSKHRIIQGFVLEGKFEHHLDLIPLTWAGTSSTRSGCSEPYPTWSWHCQGWATQSFFGQCVPEPHHLWAKNFFLIIVLTQSMKITRNAALWKLYCHCYVMSTQGGWNIPGWRTTMEASSERTGNGGAEAGSTSVIIQPNILIS